MRAPLLAALAACLLGATSARASPPRTAHPDVSAWRALLARADGAPLDVAAVPLDTPLAVVAVLVNDGAVPLRVTAAGGTLTLLSGALFAARAGRGGGGGMDSRALRTTDERGVVVAPGSEVTLAVPWELARADVDAADGDGYPEARVEAWAHFEALGEGAERYVLPLFSDVVRFEDALGGAAGGGAGAGAGALPPSALAALALAAALVAPALLCGSSWSAVCGVRSPARPAAPPPGGAPAPAAARGTEFGSVAAPAAKKGGGGGKKRN